MPLIEEGLIADLIDEYGSDATLKRVDSNTYDEYGEETTVYLPVEDIRIIINTFNSESKYIQEGLYVPDDRSFFIKGVLVVSVGDIITHTTNTYKVSSIVDAELENFVHVHECFAKKL